MMTLFSVRQPGREELPAERGLLDVLSEFWRRVGLIAAVGASIAGLVFIFVWLRSLSLINGFLVTAAAAAVLCALPPTRRWILRRGWHVFIRHQLYGVFRETRTTTRTGRLPHIIWISPTNQGVRVVVWCPTGISIERIQKIESEIRDACWAEEVSFQPARGPFAQIEIIHSGSPDKAASGADRRVPRIFSDIIRPQYAHRRTRT
jgi:hypothetical protein